MRCFTQYLDPAPRKNVSIPTSVQKYMYKSCATSGKQQIHRRKALKLGNKMSHRRTVARGVVFDTSFSLQNNTKKSAEGDKVEEREDANETIGTVHSRHEELCAFLRKIHTEASKTCLEVKTESKELCTETVCTRRNTSDSTLLVNCVGTTEPMYLREKHKSDRIGVSRLTKGVSCNKKRKLPETLVSALMKRKPKVSVLGYLGRYDESVGADIGVSNSAAKSENATCRSGVLDSNHPSETTHFRGVAGQIVKINKLQKDQDATITSDCENGDMFCGNSECKIEGDKLTESAIHSSESGNGGIFSRQSNTPLSVENKSEVSRWFNGTMNESDNQTGDDSDVLSNEEDQLQEYKRSEWNNESTLSMGYKGNESDEDCPFCPSRSGNEDNERSPQNEDKQDNFNTLNEQEISEIDLIDDLIDEEVVYLKDTL